MGNAISKSNQFMQKSFLQITPWGYIILTVSRIPQTGISGGADMNGMTETNVPAERKKVRNENERRDLMNRLKRIEGQVRGLQRMLEEDAWCPDILTQASAVNSALNSFCRVLLANHIRTCVSEDIRAGRDETVDELMDTLQKLMK